MYCESSVQQGKEDSATAVQKTKQDIRRRRRGGSEQDQAAGLNRCTGTRTWHPSCASDGPCSQRGSESVRRNKPENRADALFVGSRVRDPRLDAVVRLELADELRVPVCANIRSVSPRDAERRESGEGDAPKLSGNAQVLAATHQGVTLARLGSSCHAGPSKRLLLAACNREEPASARNPVNMRLTRASIAGRGGEVVRTCRRLRVPTRA